MQQPLTHVLKMGALSRTLVDGLGRSSRASRLLQLGLLTFAALAGCLWSLPYDGYAMTDFASFMAAGRAANAGLNPYALAPDAFLIVPGDLDAKSPNLNAPLSLPIFQAVSGLNPGALFPIWYAVSLTLYLLALRLLVGAYPQYATLTRIGWALGLVGLWRTLDAGQIYMPLLLAAVGAWLLLERRLPVGAGALIGLVVAIKPNFVVWPVLLLLAGAWLPALTALATATLLGALPALLYGPGIYADWLAASAGYTRVATFGNGSLFGLAGRLGLPWLGVVLAGALLLGLAYWAWRTRPAIHQVSSLAILAALLAGPLAWADYTVFLLPVLFTRPWPPLLRAVAILLAFPWIMLLVFAPASPMHALVFGSLYSWILLLALVALGREASPAQEHRSTTPAEPAGGPLSAL